MARTGRPPIGDERVKLPLRRDQIEDLRLIARITGTTQTAVIRRALDNEIKRVLGKQGAA